MFGPNISSLNISEQVQALSDWIRDQSVERAWGDQAEDEGLSEEDRVRQVSAAELHGVPCENKGPRRMKVYLPIPGCVGMPLLSFNQSELYRALNRAALDIKELSKGAGASEASAIYTVNLLISRTGGEPKDAHLVWCVSPSKRPDAKLPFNKIKRGDVMFEMREFLDHESKEGVKAWDLILVIIVDRPQLLGDGPEGYVDNECLVREKSPELSKCSSGLDAGRVRAESPLFDEELSEAVYLVLSSVAPVAADANAKGQASSGKKKGRKGKKAGRTVSPVDDTEAAALEVLGFDPSSGMPSAKDLRERYRQLARTHHPDKGGDTVKMQDIQGAYDVLTEDPTR